MNLSLLKERKIFEFLKDCIENIINIETMFSSHIQISSFYIVNYDISKDPPQTEFNVPIYLRDKEAYIYWSSGFSLLAQDKELKNFSFVDTAFREGKKLISMRFIPVKNSKNKIKKANNNSEFDWINIYFNPLYSLQSGNSTTENFQQQILNFKEFRDSIQQTQTKSPQTINLNNEVTKQINVPDFIEEYYDKNLFNKLIKAAFFFLPSIDSTKIGLSFLIPPTYIQREKVLTSGGIVIFWKVNDVEEQKIISDIQKIEENIWQIVSPYIYEKTIYDLQQLAYSHALHSAVAAIMARNMSHNIGSHVLANISTTNDILNQKDFKNLEKFIQQRMDFIAQISTELAAWSYPCWFYKQLMRDFYSQRYLLEYISSSEGLKPYDYNNNGNQTEKLKINFSVNNGNAQDTSIAIPGGIIGQHAFYIILEDIIRNSSKHNWAVLKDDEKKDKNLEITINVEDKPENDFITVTIWDNISNINKGSNEDLPDNWETIIPEEIQNQPLHQKMNMYLMRGLIDEAGKLRKENWGLAEMKIAAGYLQKKSIEEIGKEGKEVLDIIKAVAVKNNDKYHLGYTFKIFKPKEVLIITNNNIDDDKKDKLKKLSVYIDKELPKICDYEFCVINDENNDLVEGIKEISNGKNSSETLRKITDDLEKYPYRLFICLKDGQTINKNNLSSPLKERIVFISVTELSGIFQNSIDENKIKEIKTKLYSKWVKHLAGLRGQKNNITLLVKLTGQDTSEEELPVELKNLSDEQKQILGISKDYVPYTLPKDLRINLGSSDNEPYNNRLNLQNNFIMVETPPTRSNCIYLNNLNNAVVSNKIIYARHRNLDSATVDCLYFESLTGAAQHFPIISQLPEDDYYKKKMIYQLVENGLINVGICDERFAQSTIFSTSMPGSLTYNEYLIASGVYVVGKFLTYQIPNIQPDLVVFIEEDNNINVQLAKKTQEQNGQYKWEIDSKNNKKIDINLQFLIIHQGILDKLGETKKEIEDKLDKLKTRIPFIVVTSGRGRPENVPDNVKFLPFANLEATMLSKPHSKFILTQLLMNL